MTEKKQGAPGKGAETKPTLKVLWSRQPRADGLAGVSQGTLGWDMKVEKKVQVRVRTSGRSAGSWYWYGSDTERGVPTANTAQGPVPTPEDAMAQAEQHFLEHLGGKYRLVIRRPRGMGKPATLDAKEGR